MGLAIGVFLLGGYATAGLVTLSQPPPANGLWFGIGLTGGQVTFYAWVGVALFVIALESLALLGGMFSARYAPAPSAAGEAIPAVSLARRRAQIRRLTLANGVRATMVGVGAILLIGLVLTGAAEQVGVRVCCLSSDCTLATGICPFTLTGLWVTVALLAACAGLIAVGLAVSPRLQRMQTSSVNGRTVVASVAWNLSGTFLAFLGWGLSALGLLLPWDYFGGGPMYCSEPPCRYPYVLSGYPLGLVAVGVVALGAGAALLAYGVLGRRGARATRRGRTSSTIPPDFPGS